MNLCTRGGAVAAKKRERVAVFLPKFEILKTVLRTYRREQENGSYPWQFALVSSNGLYYSSMDFREVGRNCATGRRFSFRIIAISRFCQEAVHVSLSLQIPLPHRLH